MLFWSALQHSIRNGSCNAILWLFSSSCRWLPAIHSDVKRSGVPSCLPVNRRFISGTGHARCAASNMVNQENYIWRRRSICFTVIYFEKKQQISKYLPFWQIVVPQLRCLSYRWPLLQIRPTLIEYSGYCKVMIVMRMFTVPDAQFQVTYLWYFREALSIGVTILSVTKRAVRFTAREDESQFKSARQLDSRRLLLLSKRIWKVPNRTLNCFVKVFYISFI